MQLKQMACVALAITAALAAEMANAQVARIEIHPVAVETLTDQQILMGQRDGKRAIIAGELRIPTPGRSRLPAVVILHGSGGLAGNSHDWSQLLNQAGYATFLLDSFRGRGIVDTIEDQDQLGRLAMAIDSYRALELLAKHPRIDPKRIAVMGFSRGGSAALYANLKRLYRHHGPGGGLEFAAHVAFYPNCVTSYTDALDVAAPVRIYHGAADDWNPIGPCRAYVEQLRANSRDAQLVEFADAHHVFDWERMKKPFRVANAQNGSRCELREATEGTIVNAKSGQTFTWASDPCVQRGATVHYHPQAHKRSADAVLEFLRDATKGL